MLQRPQHDYTQRLLAAVPSLDAAAAEGPRRAPTSPSTVEGLTRPTSGRGLFRQGREVQAADDVTFAIRRGETLGLVGESGSGKSTVGRCVLRLIEPDRGPIRLGDIADRGHDASAQFRPQRKRIQMVFQDPFASLNPRRTVGRIIAEGPIAHGMPREEALAPRPRELLDLVGLEPEAIDRYPHEFSGGQRQRIGIARALALEPEVLVADEPVSALDVSVQAQVLTLLQDLQKRLGLAILFITHDLRVAAQICDRIAVMQQGRIVELQSTARPLRQPAARLHQGAAGRGAGRAGGGGEARGGEPLEAGARPTCVILRKPDPSQAVSKHATTASACFETPLRGSSA